jgi:hypothetical protein
MSWDDDKKAEAVKMYEAAEPTAETSMEVVKTVADELGESPNGVRMILTKAGVYIKKTPAKAAASKSATTTTRVSKAAAQEALTAAITDSGKVADEEIISKLTGKAAQYFTTLLTSEENTEEA